MLSAKEPLCINLKWQNNWSFLRKYPIIIFMIIYKPCHKNLFVLFPNRSSKCLAGYCKCHPGLWSDPCVLRCLWRENWNGNLRKSGVFFQSSTAQENCKNVLVSFSWGKNSYRCDEHFQGVGVFLSLQLILQPNIPTGRRQNVPAWETRRFLPTPSSPVSQSL